MFGKILIEGESFLDILFEGWYKLIYQKNKVVRKVLFYIILAKM